MKNIILLIFTVVHCFVMPQKKIQPMIGLGIGPMAIGGLPFYTASVYGGIRLNEKWCFNTHIGYTIAYFKYKEPRVGILTNSFSASYRFFKKYKASPIVKTELGYQLWCNSQNMYISSNFYATKEIEPYTMGIYKYFGPYLSEKLLLSLKGRHLEFLIGGGYRANLFVEGHTYHPTEYKILKGIELELGLTYTFQKKKQKE